MNPAPLSACSRRVFLQTSTLLAAATCLPAGLASAAPSAAGPVQRVSGVKLKLALNAYSFNDLLRTGKMSLTEVIHFCAEHGVDGLDATGYYFPGYPTVPPDAYLAKVKRTAFVNGVAYSGTGVRNDFAVADPAVRQADVIHVKQWIEVAAKLGAPVLRVFAGKKVPEGHTFAETLRWMAADFQDCAAHAERHGVMLGLQHHDDILKTAAETIQLVRAVDSAWFGVILDVGSLRQGDPYSEIEHLLPYAVSWQVKEKIWRGKQTEAIDLPRLRQLIERHGYRGYLPVETLENRTSVAHVAEFVARVRQAFA